MEKKFICMANSYKNGGRCLAGIEIEQNGSTFSVVRNSDGTPKWLRPIMNNGDNGLPESLVGNFIVLDIIQIDVTSFSPNGSHSENVHFSSIRKIGRIGCNENNLACLCDTKHTVIFFNRGKAVPGEVFEGGNYSLMLIKPENPYIQVQYDDYGHEKYRIQFTHNGNQYDFPLTDPDYINLLQNGVKSSGTRVTGDLYFALSLGVGFNDWHYKLVAGVIDLAA